MSKLRGDHCEHRIKRKKICVIKLQCIGDINMHFILISIYILFQFGTLRNWNFSSNIEFKKIIEFSYLKLGIKQIIKYSSNVHVFLCIYIWSKVVANPDICTGGETQNRFSFHKYQWRVWKPPLPPKIWLNLQSRSNLLSKDSRFLIVHNLSF